MTPPPKTTSTYLHPGIDAEQFLAAIEKAGYESGPALVKQRTLLDTFDGRLNAAGLRLEFHEASAGELVLTGGGPAAAHVAVAARPRFAADLPGGPLRARLSPILDVRALSSVVSVTTRERVIVQRDKLGKVLASVVVHDRLQGPGGAPGVGGAGWAVEVGEMAGYAKATQRVRSLLGSLGLRESDDLMVLAATAAGIDLRGHRGSPTVALHRSEPSIDAFRRVLANLADEVDANWEGTVGGLDPEFLHDLRVAVRRTRSVLAQSKRVLPSETRDRFREEFGWLGAATGPARDLDVYVIEWDSYVGPLGAEVAAALGPLFGHLSTRRETEHGALASLLSSDRYRDLMAAWRGWLTAAVDDQALGTDAHKAIGLVAARRISTANDRLVAAGRAIGLDTPAEKLHELRKDAKKLRYLLECFGAVLAQSERKVFVQRLKALQDNLGEHQDTEVHAAQLRAMSRDLHRSGGAGADTLVAMGQLAGEFERRRGAARAEFAERFAAYNTAKTRHALEVLLDSATDN
ncbi:MAG: CHAD domain-containing protein [Actinomycetota bacterium]|nr:CHAD domain-containing protein [Actinomycetota bacterium]